MRGLTEKFINEHKNETYKLSVYIVDDLANKNLSQYKNVKLVSYVPVNFQNLQKVSLKIINWLSLSLLFHGLSFSLCLNIRLNGMEEL